MKRLLFALALVLLCAAPAVLAKEEFPMKYRVYISQYPIILNGECQIEKLTLPMLPCTVYFDEARKIRYVLLSRDYPHITHVYVLNQEGTPYEFWVRYDFKS